MTSRHRPVAAVLWIYPEAILLAISGAFTKSQILERIALRVCFSAPVCAMGLVYWAVVVSGPNARSPDPVDLAAIGGLPVLGAVIFFFWTWVDKWMVIEFTLDDQAFRYRRLGQTACETRRSEEVQAINSEYWQGGSRGYVVRFVDGSEIRLARGLPNVETLAERLYGLHRLTSS